MSLANLKLKEFGFRFTSTGHLQTSQLLLLQLGHFFGQNRFFFFVMEKRHSHRPWTLEEKFAFLSWSHIFLIVIS